MSLDSATSDKAEREQAERPLLCLQKLQVAPCARTSLQESVPLPWPRRWLHIPVTVGNPIFRGGSSREESGTHSRSLRVQK